jgi:hypothetical protein
MPNSKPRIVKLALSRNRVRWAVLVGDKIVGFKMQTQFKTFSTACFIAHCIGVGFGEIRDAQSK